MKPNTPHLPPPLPLGRSERTARFLFFGSVGLVVLWLIFWPFPTPASKLSFCSFHSLTGLPCAFCGGTRAVKAMVHWDWASAMYFNPLAIGVVLVGGVLGAFLLLEAALGRRLAGPLRPRLRWAILLVGLLAILPWNWWHAAVALKTPKPELVDFSHPVVKFLLKE